MYILVFFMLAFNSLVASEFYGDDEMQQAYKIPDTYTVTFLPQSKAMVVFVNRDGEVVGEGRIDSVHRSEDVTCERICALCENLDLDPFFIKKYKPYCKEKNN